MHAFLTYMFGWYTRISVRVWCTVLTAWEARNDKKDRAFQSEEACQWDSERVNMEPGCSGRNCKMTQSQGYGSELLKWRTLRQAKEIGGNWLQWYLHDALFGLVWPTCQTYIFPIEVDRSSNYFSSTNHHHPCSTEVCCYSFHPSPPYPQMLVVLWYVDILFISLVATEAILVHRLAIHNLS